MLYDMEAILMSCQHCAPLITLFTLITLSICNVVRYWNNIVLILCNCYLVYIGTSLVDLDFMYGVKSKINFIIYLCNYITLYYSMLIFIPIWSSAMFFALCNPTYCLSLPGQVVLGRFYCNIFLLHHSFDSISHSPIDKSIKCWDNLLA